MGRAEVILVAKVFGVGIAGTVVLILALAMVLVLIRLPKSEK
jgi:hypothetical protein